MILFADIVTEFSYDAEYFHAVFHAGLAVEVVNMSFDRAFGNKESI